MKSNINIKQIIESYIKNQIVKQLNEEKSKDDILNELKNYLQQYFKHPLITEYTKELITGRTLSLISVKNSLNNYSISVNDNFKITLDFYTEFMNTQQSLDDPTKNYKTTSSKIVKIDKIKLKKEVDNIDKAKKEIDKYFKKL
jgi:hypothetical protein